jgi:hypothetical protein
VGIIHPDDVHSFAHWDSSVVKSAPAGTHVLTVHGLADATVPPCVPLSLRYRMTLIVRYRYDAMIYARIFGDRTPGTHNLCMLEGADHNFTGCRDTVVRAIVTWWAAVERGDIRTGVFVAPELEEGISPDRSSKL